MFNHSFFGFVCEDNLEEQFFPFLSYNTMPSISLPFVGFALSLM
jgi:hypothetical protein